MKLLDLTLPDPESNLACDEALLDRCEARGDGEVLRFWEPDRYFAVIGYSNSGSAEVRLEEAARKRIPVLRRISGGGTVLQGPGCLNYSLILKIESEPSLKNIRGTNRFILERNAAAVEKITPLRAEIRGDSDLCVNGLKFSGNAQRRKKNFILYHGSFLLNMDLALIEALLPPPSKEPAYRKGRSHRDFLMNLPVSAPELKRALCREWRAAGKFRDVSLGEIQRLAVEKYSSAAWNEKL